MSRPEIKAGYLLELEENVLGKHTIEYAHVNYNIYDELGYKSKTLWGATSHLERSEYTRVLKIYGRTHNYKLDEFNLSERKLLWELQEPEKISMNKIVDELETKIKDLEITIELLREDINNER